MLALIVVGGAAYYVMHQNSASQTPTYQPDTTLPINTQGTTNTDVQAQNTDIPQGQPSVPTCSTPAGGVSGMCKYTDSDFGFSFWYPNTWKVQETPVQNVALFGGSVSKKIVISSGKPSADITLEEVFSTNRSVTASADTFSFNTSSHVWMHNSQAADVTGNNSMGGLHIFTFGGTSGTNLAVPLTAKNFVISDPNTALQTQPLMRTLVALDLAVATPLTANEQLAFVHEEARAYGIESVVTLNDPGTISLKVGQTALHNYDGADSYEAITLDKLNNTSADITYVHSEITCVLCGLGIYRRDLSHLTVERNQTNFAAGGQLIVLLGVSEGSATISVGSDTNNPLVTIDGSDQNQYGYYVLMSASGNPTISGTSKDTNQIYVSVYGSSGAGEIIKKSDTLMTPVNGKWSIRLAKASDSSFQLTPGTYSVAVIDGPSGTTLANGNLTIAPIGATASMSQYTDSNFGFSFWYPHYSSTWSVQTATVPDPQSPSTIQGGTIDGIIDVIDSKNNTEYQRIQIEEVTVSNGTTVNSDGVERMTYSYNSQSGKWTASSDSPYIGDQRDPSLGTTLGGQQIFRGVQGTNASHGNVVVVPLSSTKLLVISDVHVAGGVNQVFAQTIVPTGVSVDPLKLAAALQVESGSYAIYPH